jgi:hypothetical protein
MDIDPETAKALGFPKPVYTVVEHERRWLCRDVPCEKVIRSERVADLYVTGSRPRLREARPVDGGPARLRLSRKLIGGRVSPRRSIFRRKSSSSLLPDLVFSGHTGCRRNFECAFRPMKA